MSNNKIIKLGTRGSKLALAQAEMVASALEAVNIKSELVIIKTTGDIETKKSLSAIGGKALFAKEIQQALINDEIDLGVHSLKDLETTHPEGLELLGTLKREDPSDVLIFRKDLHLSKDITFTVGTCSPRRAAFIKDLYPNATIILLRGNVDTRLSKVISGEFDAIILAAAGLNRLNIFSQLTNCIDYLFLPFDKFPPASCQGIVAIEGKNKYKDIVDLINNKEAYKMAQIERSIILAFGGNCHSAIGIHTKLNEDSVDLLIRYEDEINKEIKTIEKKISTFEDIKKDFFLE